LTAWALFKFKLAPLDANFPPYNFGIILGNAVLSSGLKLLTYFKSFEFALPISSQRLAAISNNLKLSNNFKPLLIHLNPLLSYFPRP
jgi:hypothetical protein